MNSTKNVILVFIANTSSHLMLIKEKWLGTINKWEDRGTITLSDKTRNE